MNKIFNFAFASIAFGLIAAAASAADSRVMVSVCEKVGVDGSWSSESRYLAGGTYDYVGHASIINTEKGVLELTKRAFEVGGTARLGFTARFTDKNGKLAVAELTLDANAFGIAKSGACWTEADLGSLLVQISNMPE